MSENKIKLNDEMLKNVAGGDQLTWQMLLNNFTVATGFVNTIEDMERLCNSTKDSAQHFLEVGYLTRDEYDNAIKNIDIAYFNFQQYIENN